MASDGFVLPRTSLKAPVCSMAIFVRCLADLFTLLTRNNSRQCFICTHKGYVWLFAARYPHSFHWGVQVTSIGADRTYHLFCGLDRLWIPYLLTIAIAFQPFLPIWWSICPPIGQSAYDICTARRPPRFAAQLLPMCSGHTTWLRWRRTSRASVLWSCSMCAGDDSSWELRGSRSRPAR